MILRLILLSVAGLLVSMCVRGNYASPDMASLDDLWTQVQTEARQYLPTPGPKRHLVFVATGDSVAAGADISGGRNVAFPALLAQRLRAEYDVSLAATDVSCSGATSANYLHDAQCGFAVPQVDGLRGNASFTTITVGADDLIVWLTKNRECVLDARITDLLRKQCDLYKDVIAPFEANLTQILDRATTASEFVVLTQYYDVFSPSFSPAVSHLPYAWTDGVNQGIDLIDESISRVASQYGDKIILVDLRPVFATHEWGDSNSYVTRLDRCSLLDLSTPWSECWWVPGIHPNERGQQAIADEIWSGVSRRLATQP